MGLLEIHECFERVKGTRSRIDKEVYLRTCHDQALLKEMLRLAYDWKLTYGLTAEGFDQGQGRDFITDVDDEKWKEFTMLLAELNARVLTGNDARYAVARVLSQCSRPVQSIMRRVLNRHLELGVSDKTISKMYPGLITTFGLQLCEKLDLNDPSKDFSGYIWVAEPKLDGVRAIIGMHNGLSWSAMSRGGNELFNCEKVIEALKSTAGTDEWLFDGELLAQTFHHTVSTVHSGMDTGQTLRFHVFDVLNRETFPVDDTPWNIRHQRLESIAKKWQEGGLLVEVPSSPYLVLGPINGVSPLLRKAIEDGYEGLVLKRVIGGYKAARTRDWLKYKIRETHDYTVVDAVEGTGKYNGMLGALVIDVDGVQVQVGSGFTDEERHDMWWSFDTAPIKGKVVEVTFQEKTPDGSLRFPVFIRMRPDK